jgi:predicted branched-subunit amino acid permease/glutathione synthase/RimK-type ligase-like ATP-grasp enzyme
MIGLVTNTALLEQPAGGQWVASEEDRSLATLLVFRGLPVRVVAWDDDSVDWSQFSLLVIRSTWNYMHDPARYLAWLRRVDALTTVCPPRPVIEWNLHKRYLAALEEQGVPILPTAWCQQGLPVNLALLLKERGWGRVVLKPAVGSNGIGVVEVTSTTLHAGQAALEQLVASGDVLIQPSLPAIAERGEHALVLLRAQEQREWIVANAWRTVPCPGGTTRFSETLLVPTEEEIALARQTLRAMYRELGPIMQACLYVRVDLVQDETGTWRLMEVALHEPRLLLHQRRELAWHLMEAIHARYLQARARGAAHQDTPPQPAHAQGRSAAVECREGALAGLPLALSIIPLMTIFAVLARAAGLSAFVAQAMSVLVFSGVQLVATQLLLVGSPLALIVGIGTILNARHLLYGATLTPYVRALPLGWRCLLGYLLTDEAFAVGSTHYQRPGNPKMRHWYLLGAGLTVWVAAQGGTALGSALGTSIPASWNLSFTATLSFIALAVLALTDRASLAAALTAGVLSVGAAGLPLQLGLLAAALGGILAGVGVEALTQRPSHKEATHEPLAAHRAFRRHHLFRAFRLLSRQSGRALAPAPAGITLPARRAADGAPHAIARAEWSAANTRDVLPPDRRGHRRSGGVADPPRPADGGGGDERALVAAVDRSRPLVIGGTADDPVL